MLPASTRPETKYVFSHNYGETRRSYSDAFADAYHEKVGGMVAFRMKLAPTLVASMWMTAWKDAGSPDLDKLLKQPVSKDDKDKLDRELRCLEGQRAGGPAKACWPCEPMKAAARPDLINAARDMPTLLGRYGSQDPNGGTSRSVSGCRGPDRAAAPGTTKVKTKVKPADGPGPSRKKPNQPPSPKRRPTTAGAPPPVRAGSAGLRFRFLPLKGGPAGRRGHPFAFSRLLLSPCLPPP